MKKQHLVWQQELHEPSEKAVAHARANLEETCQEPSGYSSLLLSEACQCPHLEKWLPNLLDLDFCKSVSGPRSQPLLIKDPIHALHLSSQLEENSTVLETNFRNYGTSPWIYGEEQQRTVALSQAGIPETFFPLTKEHLFHEFNTPNPDAPKPLHADTVILPSKPAATSAAASAVTPAPSSSTTTTTAATPKQPEPTATASSDAKQDDGKQSNETSNDLGKTKSTPEQVRSSTPSVSFASPIVQKKEDAVDEKNSNTEGATTKKEDSESKTGEADSKEKVKEEKSQESKEEEGYNKSSLVEDVEMADVSFEKLAQSKKEEGKEGATKKEVEGTKDGPMKKEEEGTKDGSTKEDKTLEAKDVKMEEASTNKDGDSDKKTEEKEDSKDSPTDEKNDLKEDTKGQEEPKGEEEKQDDGKRSEKMEEDKQATDSGMEEVSKKEDDKVIKENNTKEDATEEGKKLNDSQEEAKKEDVKTDKTDANVKGSTETEEKSNDADMAEKEDDKAGKASGNNEATKTGEQESNEVEDKADKTKDSMKDSSGEEKKSKDTEDAKEDDKAEKKSEDAEKAQEDDKAEKKNDEEEAKKGDGKAENSEESKEGASGEGEKSEGSQVKVEEDKPTVTETKKESSKDDKPDQVVSKPPQTESKDKPTPTETEEKPTAAESKEKPAPQTSTSASSATATDNSAVAKPGTASTPSSATAANTPAPSAPKYHLSEPRYMEISRQEDQIKVIRNLLAKRVSNTKKKGKKRKSDSHANNSANSALQNLPGNLQYTNERAIIDLTAVGREEWLQTKATACRKVEGWLEQFRSSRRSYWEEESMIQQMNTKKQKISSSLSTWTTTNTLRRTCHLCENPRATGDEIMQCLECTFVGCGPTSVCHQSNNQHILQHMFLTGHKFAVTCGVRAEVFCFSCGDFVYHRVFDQERERLDLAARIPWLAWNDHALRRSFDPLHFVRVEEYGIVWRGLMATYPPLVPKEHQEAARYCLQRQSVFEGHLLNAQWPLMGRRALDFAIHKNKQAPLERWRVPLPVGMYNLGNTCFMSSIIQCLIHCVPLQRYFLKDIGHNHKSCKTYRNTSAKGKQPTGRSAGHTANDICLACEMDALFLDYYRRSTGRDVVAILDDLAGSNKMSVADKFADISRRDEESFPKGEPIVIDKMLHVAWKSSGMNHLAGYEQRDAHEFLHAFLDILGKQICQHRARVDAAIDMARNGSSFGRQTDNGHHDIIKHLFEGTLRSVLVCEECGSKRTLSEAFLNVSLPLSKELMMNNPGSSNPSENLSLSRCLDHFTAPEKLADPVDCPACGKKTPTKKQHTISRLPRVLCIHLKRFHAALNKKIDDFVAFPAYGLNMGPHLPHWREVTTVPDNKRKPVDDGSTTAAPEILYDLFGTVNHRGGLQSGHYIVDLKVQDQWFSINDQHVGISNEANVLSDTGAYILFYTRRT